MIIDINGTGIKFNKERDIEKTMEYWYQRIMTGQEENTGWAELPVTFDKSLLDQIKKTAEEIKEKCSIFVVIGIGGSYLGARAVIDALNGSKEDWPEIIFAGFNMSATYLQKVTNRMKHEATCLCVISKSGTTLEPLLTYSILKKLMFDKYGSNAGERIYVITNENSGTLREEANKYNYKSFVVPDNIGGRYSVLSVVGLLPIAVAGHDIETLLDGASSLVDNNGWNNELLHYAVARLAMQRSGKNVEIFEFFELNLQYFGEWLKQLFGESEGKDGKGAYPACLCFSRDLHSIGQFLQQGNPIFYETLVQIGKHDYDFDIPEEAGYPYAGKTLETINDCSEAGVVIAHQKDGIPITTIEIPVLDEYNLGKLIYFFEMSCALSAYTLELNPFDQPGVEMYKSEMKKLVEKV